MEDGPPIFEQDFTCPALLADLINFYLYGTITHFGATFHLLLIIKIRPLAWSDFARRYFRNLG